MRAAVFQGRGRGHRIETLPDPTPGPGEVVVRVRRSGICATDITITSESSSDTPLDRLYQALSTPGTVLGHEIGGEVVAVGSAAGRLRVGDKVAPTAFSGCGSCATCIAGKADWCAQARARMGGYAEYALADEAFCVRLPATLGDDDSALLEPMATSLHAVTLANLNESSRVAVIGAGPIGLGGVFFARRANVHRLAAVARSDRHRELALAMGADSFVTQGSNIEEELCTALGGRPDVVLELSGAQGVINQAATWLRPAGTIVAAGATSPTPDPVIHALAVGKEIKLQYSASYLRDDLRYIADIFDSGDTRLRQLISRRISLDEFPTVFEGLRTRHAECKVMVDPALQ